MKKLILPELGEGISKATVSYWYFKDGDKVGQNDDLVELATDKATFNLPSPCSGTITEILFHEGDTVNTGEVLAVIEEA
ncbi:MAG: biotin/lipoyl-binding protein [Candidatus Omnitrophica bacterium]|nr:biotin/lipoyl-binding protein [Candidatus Omnitrophota bacterium]